MNRLVLALVLVLVGSGSRHALAQVPPESALNKPGPGEQPTPGAKLPEKDTWTLVPLPIVYTDPNVGVGFGFMPVGLLHPEKRIEWIFAPSVEYNSIVGTSFVSRVFWYPTAKEQIVAYNSISTGPNMEESLEVHEENRLLEEHSRDYARGYFIVDATKRFFGLGSGTRSRDETAYRLREYGVDGEFGYRFDGGFRLGPTARYRNAKIGPSIVQDLPDTLERFPRIQGVDPSGVDIFGFGAHAVLDLRDDEAIPNDGFFADAFVEFSVRGLVSETRYERWGAQVIHHLPIVRPGTWVNVVRLRYQGLDGDPHVPFWELPSLGGSENLRGFGVGRFTDDQSIVATIEERFRFLDMTIRDNHLLLEAAPFLDAGRVFGPDDPLSTARWQFVPGAGIRMLLPDSSIVARFDLGYSIHEGSAVFVVLGYPF
ncbi:MAG TPA: BamA/TamA family outer membrane protein [Planctomycetota bacterium]|nr:BamA/TamA family outer membrane protein [Planctomycetota bacterium]